MLQVAKCFTSIFKTTFTLQGAKMFANKNVDFHFHVYTSVSIFNIALTLQVAKMFARADFYFHVTLLQLFLISLFFFR